MRWPNHLTAALLILGASAPLAGSEPEEPAAAPAATERAWSSLEHGGVAYRATRFLVARSRKLNKEGWLEAETEFLPGVGLKYTVLREGGDEGIRNRVLRKVLEQEVEASAPSRSPRVALSDANYRLNESSPSPDGEFRWKLEPRRADPGLVNGYAVLDEDGRLRRIEGQLAKSPSFWVRSVTVCRRYESVSGHTVPVHLESVADVRFVGLAEFSMSLDYEEVDGRPVATQRHAARDGRPSPWLLALHYGAAR